jgi:hypothetical protein
MKLLFSSLAILLATSAVSAAAQQAATADAAPVAQPGPASSPSDRPSEERLSLARQLMALTMPADSELQQMKDLSVQAASIDTGDGTSADDRAEEAQFMERLIVKAAPVIHMHMLSIRDVTAFVYAREFSASELQTMISFAETPAGKHYFAREHFVDLDPAIVEQMMMLRDAMKPIMFDVRKELCQEATARRIAAGDKKATCPLSQPDSAQG